MTSESSFLQRIVNPPACLSPGKLGLGLGERLSLVRFSEWSPVRPAGQTFVSGATFLSLGGRHREGSACVRGGYRMVWRLPGCRDNPSSGIGSHGAALLTNWRTL